MSVMTIRVYQREGATERELVTRRTEVGTDALANPLAYPPCTCPRCRHKRSQD